MKTISKIKLIIIIVIKSLRSLIDNIVCLSKGQDPDALILKTAHQIEKGLCIASPRPLWGWEKAKKIIDNINKSRDEFTYKTAYAVLYAFVQHKLNASQEDKNRAEIFNESFKLLDIDRANGGSMYVSSIDYKFDIPEIEKLFNFRHSVRDFEDSEVSNELINKAISLANRCPSACNRQPTRVYVISSKVWNKYTDDPNQVYNSTKHILITAKRNAFSLDEINDWIVSASIFAGYLSLSLTAYGIGGCVIRKSLLDDIKYKKLCRYANIPKDEKIILEIAIGNLKKNFKVPVSNRKNLNNIVEYID